jgi:Protein of unknown function (DUF2855)
MTTLSNPVDHIDHFIVRRDDPLQHQWISGALPTLADGEALLAVDLFSFTANNVTYAMFGDKMQYWQFFPTGDPAYGSIPVWGFADVVASKADSVAVGERFYGYFPMSTHLKVNVERATPHSFVDGAPHRRDLAAIYNQYLRCTSDSMYRADREDEIAILRPLFATSFLLEDFLADNQFFGAKQVVLSSASSKTAYGTAACLAARGGIDVIGLTSKSNVAFVQSLGCYANVVTYDELATLDATTPTVYADFAGSAPLRAQLHQHFGDALKYSCSIGGTHWEDLGGARDLPGPKPTLFFAPSQAKKRFGEWGPAGFQSRLTAAWDRFLLQVTQSKAPWMNVITTTGQDAIAKTVAHVIKGEVKPNEGHVLRFS